MIPDGVYTAVVDRIEGTLAALQVEGDDDLYDLVVGEEELPPAARHQDAVVRVELEGETLVDATYREDATRERRTEAQDRFDRLAKRPRDDDSDPSQ